MKFNFTTKIETISHWPFGVADNKGRMIGAKIILSTMEAEVKKTDSTYWHSSKNVDCEGSYFGVRIHATRDSNSFGATTNTNYFKTTAERDKYIKKRIAAMRKRYESN